MSVLERSEGEELDSLVSFSKSPARAAMDVVVNAFGSRGSSGGTSGNINISKKRLRQLESIMVGSDSISDEEEGRVEGTPLSFVTQIGFDCFPKTKKPTLQSEGHRLPEETEEMKPDIVEEPEIENLRLNKASDNVCDTVRDLLKNVANIDQLLEKANKENSGENTIESANVLEEDIFQSDAVENSTSKSTDLTSLKEAATVNSFDGVMKSLSPAQKSSKASITDYFKKTNGLFQLKDASEKLLKLEKLLQEKSDEVIAKDTIITDLQMQLERKHSESVDMNLCFSKEKEQMTQTLVSNIRSLAKRERISRREQISKDNVRIGSIYIRRDGITALEDWVDGELFQELKEMKDSHQADKEFIDNKKRELAKMSKDLSSSSTQDFLSRRREISELQHILNVRIQLWKNQGIEIQKRDSEILYLKQKHMKAIHLVQEEFRSAWNDFPVIKSRYLLLHMVGRGGFSEVWKAFDLEKLSYVAVKIHEVQSEWSESRKTSFIRHAERENRILSNLNHSRIVKCYDVSLYSNFIRRCSLNFFLLDFSYQSIYPRNSFRILRRRGSRHVFEKKPLFVRKNSQIYYVSDSSCVRIS